MSKRFWYLLSFLFFVTSLIMSASFIYFVKFYHHDLPDYKQLEQYNPAMTSRIYSIDGDLIGEYFKENRIYTPYDQIPKHLINAFIAAEDQNYWSHPGIDYTSLIRAIFQNALNLGSNKSLIGGSTITQQVVKNFLLSNERTLTRKIKEAILSFRISKVYSKEKILELYLNQIYFGNGAYGVSTAALIYFNKQLKELSLGETAFIAGLPKAPENYNPAKNYLKAKIRRDYVINRMHEEGMISSDEAKRASVEKIVTHPRKNYILNCQQEYYNELIRRQIAELYGYKALNEGGLNIFTTINPEWQNHVQNALRYALIQYDQKYTIYRGPVAKIDITDNIAQQLTTINTPLPAEWNLAVVTKFDANKMYADNKQQKNIRFNLEHNKWIKTGINYFSEIFHPGDVIYYETDEKGNNLIRQIPKVNGGMIAIDPKTGKILASSGGFLYGLSEFDRATQAIRQPGSTIKSFVYLAGLEHGIQPNKIYSDTPIEIYQGLGLPLWKPKNYTNNFLGSVTFRQAFEKSLNTVTARVAQEVGIKKVAEVIKNAEVNDNPKNNFAIVLGSSETTLLRMVSSHSIFVNGGKKIYPYAIEYITDSLGHNVYKSANVNIATFSNTDQTPPSLVVKTKQVTDERSAYQMLSLLEGVIQRGSGRSAKSLNMNLFGKTGTTNDSKDVWFIGGNNDVLVGIYLGYDQPKDLGKKVTGGSAALPGFIYFMQKIKDQLSDQIFEAPHGLVTANTNLKDGSLSTKTIDGTSVIAEYFKIGKEPEPEESSTEGQHDDVAVDEDGNAIANDDSEIDDGIY